MGDLLKDGWMEPRIQEATDLKGKSSVDWWQLWITASSTAETTHRLCVSSRQENQWMCPVLLRGCLWALAAEPQTLVTIMLRAGVELPGGSKDSLTGLCSVPLRCRQLC